MTTKEHLSRHDKEIAEIRMLLKQLAIMQVDDVKEIRAQIKETNKTLDRFIKSMIPERRKN